MSNITFLPGIASLPNPYADLIVSRGRELAAAVAAIAEGERTDLIADDDRSRLVIALTLIAAGLPLSLVASAGSTLRVALDGLDDGNGTEFFLLQNGLTVDHFHALRERLDDAGATSRGDAA